MKPIHIYSPPLNLEGICFSIPFENCARSLLLDKSSFCGGNSTKATSGINGAGTKTQKSKSIPDTAEIFVQDTLKGGAKKPELAKVLCLNSAADVDWLVDKFDLDLSLVARLGGHSQPRTHRGKERFPGMTITYAACCERLLDYVRAFGVCFNMRVDELKIERGTVLVGLFSGLYVFLVAPPGGTLWGVSTKGSEKRSPIEALIQMLEKVAEKTTRARIITKAEVFKLVQNGRSVVGCMYRKAGKEVKEFGPMILASGGFGADFGSDSLLATYRPDLLHLPTTNGEHCTGSGLTLKWFKFSSHFFQGYFFGALQWLSHWIVWWRFGGREDWVSMKQCQVMQLRWVRPSGLKPLTSSGSRQGSQLLCDFS